MNSWKKSDLESPYDMDGVDQSLVIFGGYDENGHWYIGTDPTEFDEPYWMELKKREGG